MRAFNESPECRTTSLFAREDCIMQAAPSSVYAIISTSEIYSSQVNPAETNSYRNGRETASDDECKKGGRVLHLPS